LEIPAFLATRRTIRVAPAIEARPGTRQQDRTRHAFAGSQVDGPANAGRQRYDGGLAALAHDLHGAMSALAAQVLDVNPDLSRQPGG
jgi:hypothetical protein